MDKDLKDAVLAAFDGKPDDAKGQAESADAAGAEAEAGGEEAGGGDAEAADGAAAPKPGAAKKRVVTATAAGARRVAAAGPGPGRKAGTAGETVALAAARPKTGVSFAAEGGDEARAPVRAHAATGLAAPAPAKRGAGGVVSLVVTLVLAVLVVVLLVQVMGLRAEIRRQEGLIREIKNLARVTVSVYQEPGKRPQQVIAGHDVDAEGRVKIGRMLIQPLPEE